MKFFTFKQLYKSWSVWVLAGLSSFATLDFSTTWVDNIISDHYKPVVYAGLGFLGLLVRSIKQNIKE